MSPAPFSSLYLDKARHHRPDQMHFPGRPQVRHCLQPDRHWQRRNRYERALGVGALQPDGMRGRAQMDVRHVADAVLYMANLPLDANVQFMTVMATKMPFVGRG